MFALLFIDKNTQYQKQRAEAAKAEKELIEAKNKSKHLRDVGDSEEDAPPLKTQKKQQFSRRHFEFKCRKCNKFSKNGVGRSPCHNPNCGVEE